MKKSLLVAASALLFSVGAANIGDPKLEYHEDLIAGMVDWEDLEPRPARGNYPACRRHRSDDRCIQLYERGVRESLAQWKFGADAQAMGGPFEPDTSDSAGAKAPADTSASAGAKSAHSDAASTMQGTGSGHMSGDHSGHSASSGGSSSGNAQSGTQMGAKPMTSGGASSSSWSGTGGPEVRTGYPPCSRTVTDSCIQLYERGVTGQGN